ncbi:MAG TPA: flagellar hook basal-body protein [Caulobacteraceae bacterium]|nr:flagellar hook basal-body protein [Caulobacteraceae bacterium]
MNGTFHIGATGLRSQQRALDVIANNIANINTPAFKRTDVRFSELVRGADGEGAPSGVGASAKGRVFAQGDLRRTGEALDLAISGEGFLELLGPAGRTLLWRGGSMKVDRDGFLAAAEGARLKAMISVPAGASDLTIGRGGEVSATVDGETIEIGRLDVVLPKDSTALSALDGGLYEASDEADLTVVAPGEEGGGVLIQGSLEGANVQLSDEMVALLMTQRAYAASAQIVQAGDQLMSIANSLRR